MSKKVSIKEVPESIDKKIAKVFLLAAELREGSFNHVESSKVSQAAQEQAKITGKPIFINYGSFYTKSITRCIEEACEKYEVPKSLIPLFELSLSNYWNDTLDWAEKYNSIF